MSKDTVTVTDNASGKSVDLPIEKGTMGPGVVDVRTLYGQTGYFTFDPGYASTGSCRSSITYIDGDAGVLLYRGYPIEQLSKQSSYLEVCYLLLHGELPAPQQMSDFESTIRNHTMVSESIRKFYDGFHYDAHPMAMMVATMGALSSFYHDSIDINDPQHRIISAHRLIAKMPTMAAYAYKHSIGQPFIYPKNDLSYAENFLHMMFSVPAEDFVPSPTFVKALELLLILHADHEQNASTSTVRLTGSSGANPFASIAAGIASLWGPSHGGANEAVIEMLENILESGQTIPEVIERAKDKNDTFRLMGFGHRVYKNYDPRAKIIRQMCHDVLKELGSENQPLLETAMELERIVLEDEFFIERKLYPNVDFYSGIIMKAMGIPTSMFTVMFAMGRTVGWISHWKEMLEDPELRIGRPRQVYTGHARRDYPKS